MAVLRIACLVVVFLQWSVADHPDGDHTEYRPGECLPGDKHKELACPEPEGPEYKACFQWRNETCCTASLTEQLAIPRVTDVDGFRWDNCGNLSEDCHNYFVHMECFYRCSPNVAHWHNHPFDSALLGMPLCREFCDGWFDACRMDSTCATNWISDWVYVNGVNFCKNSSCTTFEERYGSGEGLCNTLWGPSFNYINVSSSDPDRQCMTVTWDVDQPNPNIVALRNIFGDAVDTVEPATCSGHGLSVWSALVNLVMALGLTITLL